MAKNSETARNLLLEIAEETRPYAEKEFISLQRFATESGGPELKLWDTAFYSEKLRREELDFDKRLLAPYFESSRVLQGCFRTAEALYGITITSDDATEACDPKVKCYSIHNENGHLIAKFYADLYARPGLKAPGASHLGLRMAGPRANDFHRSSISANFPVPSVDSPSLLTLEEASTVFHELGHLFHFCLSESKYHTLFGTRVEKDMIELP